MSKLDKLPVKQEVINKLAIGESQTGIAKQVGVNQSTISRFKEKNEEIIEKEKSNLIGLLPTAREYAQKRLHTGKRLADIEADENRPNTTIYKEPKDVISAQKDIHKIATNILQISGILSPNTIHLGDDNSQNITISPSYQAFLDFQSNYVNNKAIDADNTQPVDEVSDNGDN